MRTAATGVIVTVQPAPVTTVPTPLAQTPTQTQTVATRVNQAAVLPSTGLEASATMLFGGVLVTLLGGVVLLGARTARRQMV